MEQHEVFKKPGYMLTSVTLDPVESSSGLSNQMHMILKLGIRLPTLAKIVPFVLRWLDVMLPKWGTNLGQALGRKQASKSRRRFPRIMRNDVADQLGGQTVD